jgi:hypothetical protein
MLKKTYGRWSELNQFRGSNDVSITKSRRWSQKCFTTSRLLTNWLHKRIKPSNSNESIVKH